MMVDTVGRLTLQIMSQAKRYNAWLYSLLKPYLSGRIAEVGSGTGTFTSKLVADGFAVTAIDIDPNYLRLVKRRLAVVTQRQDLQAATLPSMLEGRFDTVVAVNVIEHLARADQALKNIGRMLTPGGRCLILVPAAKWAYGSLDASLGHVTRYDKQELVGLIHRVGLKPIIARSLNFPGLFGWWWNSRVVKRQILPSWQVRLFDVAFSPWLELEKWVNFPIGLSLLAVTKK